MRLFITCRREDARLGATRVVRRHWRAGATKFLAAIIVTRSQDQQQAEGLKREKTGVSVVDRREEKRRRRRLLVREEDD